MRYRLASAVALALACLALLAGCGGEEEKPGDAGIYQEIAAMTDCEKLQAQFDTAMTNAERYGAGDSRREAPLSYAEAANDRIEELGC